MPSCIFFFSSFCHIYFQLGCISSNPKKQQQHNNKKVSVISTHSRIESRAALRVFPRNENIVMVVWSHGWHMLQSVDKHVRHQAPCGIGVSVIWLVWMWKCLNSRDWIERNRERAKTRFFNCAAQKKKSCKWMIYTPYYSISSSIPLFFWFVGCGLGLLLFPDVNWWCNRENGTRVSSSG